MCCVTMTFNSKVCSKIYFRGEIGTTVPVGEAEGLQVLGIFLGINEAELKKFESKRKSNDVLKCFLDTLMFWLNSGDSNLSTLAKAVERAGYRRLAQDIRLKYQGTCSIKI